MAMAFGNLEDK